jgi:hypothetical protein
MTSSNYDQLQWVASTAPDHHWQKASIRPTDSVGERG